MKCKRETSCKCLACDPSSSCLRFWWKGLVGHHNPSLFDLQGTFLHMCNWGGLLNFPGGSDGKASACNAEGTSLISGLGRSPGEGNGNPLQDSCLENLMDRGAWWATVCEVTKSWTRLRELTFFFLSLTSRLRNTWSFISYLGSAQPPPSSCFYGVPTIKAFLLMGRNCSAWDPSVSCLKTPS